MDSFNRYLDSLRDLSITLEKISDAKEIRGELQEVDENYEGVEPILDLLDQPLSPEIRTVKIYYPISNGQFGPVTVTYSIDRPITRADLFNSITAFYRQKLSKENINAYLATGKYNHLTDPIFQNPIFGGISIDDVVDAKYLLRLDPYQDGYLLILEKY